MTPPKMFVSFLTMAALACLSSGCFLTAAIDRTANGVTTSQDVPVSNAARKLHASITVADLHSDAMLWNRDIDVRNDWGHVDIPRLIEGNVTLQGFTIATRMPASANVDHTRDAGDLMMPLAFGQGWPSETWGSMAKRTLYMAARLDAAANRSGGKFTIIRTAGDLRAYLARRQRDPAMTAGLIGIEGAHNLEGNLANLEIFYQAGIRMIAPTHFFDNDIGGSAHGVEKAGLTPLGREMIRRMDAMEMIIDLSHASPKTIEDVLALTTRPVLVSHTGVRGTCPNNRNLSDDQLRAIAVKGGVIGIAFFEKATCGEDVASVVKAIRHAVSVAGIDHVGLGSDYDGFVKTPFDAAHLVMLTDALLQDGFTEEEVGKIMGGNTVRLLAALLPGAL